MLLLEAATVEFFPDRVVPKNVDAALHLPDLIERINRRERLCSLTEGTRRQQSQDCDHANECMNQGLPPEEHHCCDFERILQHRNTFEHGKRTVRVVFLVPHWGLMK